MSRIFHRPDLSLLRPAETPAAGAVLDTLKQTNLDPREVLLVGSAALALYGVILENDPYIDLDQQATRPGDVDVLSTGSYARSVYDGLKHKGLDVRLKTENTNRATILRVDSSPLPLDVITYYNPHNSMQRYDERFRAKVDRDSRAIEGAGGIRVATERKIEQELAGRVKELKSKTDLANLRNHLRTRR